MNEELKSKIEAILFCSSEGIHISKLAKLLSLGSLGHVKSILGNLKNDFEARKAGVELIENNGMWKLRVKDEFINLVRESAKPEIEQAVLETLAYIAHKGGAKQSAVVRVRSNKAYEHILALEELGFIESKKEGTTRFIKPTKKFYDYFNLRENEDLQVKA